MKTLVALAALAALLLAPSAFAAWPPTAEEAVACLQDEAACEGWPVTAQRILYEADPRNWPCTCDPPKEILTPIA